MPHRPTHISQNNDNHRFKSPASTKRVLQHGFNGLRRTHTLPDSYQGESTLLGIPSESLTHVTSFLPPAALLALGRTNKQLHEHIGDDNTWRRAYVCQFLGISPEDDLRDGGEKNIKSLMIRRTETSWKREFVVRWNLRRRYERSRKASCTHVPVHSTVVDMYLTPANSTSPPGLLVASLHYGVVARSYPLTGKILRGYFDAAGTLNGLGIGNPNAEFSPDVSKVAMTAEGGTARILWGLRNGVVAVTHATKALDAGSAPRGRWTRCPAGQQHDGPIEDAAWAGGSSSYCVTGGVDGRVKLWDGKRVVCLWTSERQKVHDPCVKVAISLPHGVIACVMRSGEIFAWTGFKEIFATDEVAPDHELLVCEFRLSAPPRAVTPSGQDDNPPTREVTALHLHCPSDNIVSLISIYKSDTHFYRADVNLASGETVRIAYGDGNTGVITAFEPMFGPSNTSFVITGDSLGCVTIYPWSDMCPFVPIPALHNFEAHGNGDITAIRWTPTVLVTGSSLGVVSVWDSLDFSALKSFPSMGQRPSDNTWDAVSRIIVDKDVIVASAGSKVMGWVGGPAAGSERKGKQLKMSSRANNTVAKWQRQVELYKDIAESRQELEDEQTHTRRAFGREREQMTHLDTLGLSEVEALEYVLMLSRDEEDARRRSSPPHAAQDEGVFIGDFDDLQTPVPSDMPFFMSGTSSTSTPPRSNHQSPRLYPRVAPSSSNAKVQVSPRVLPEPMEAGMSISPISRESSLPDSVSSSLRNNIPSDDSSSFPSMSSTPTYSKGASTPIRRSFSGSPESVRSAWSNPLRFSVSEGPSPPASSNASASSSYRRTIISGPSSPSRQRGPVASGLSMSRVSAESQRKAESPSTSPPRLTQAEADEREADDLKYAIELSLAEARSRGDDV